MTGRHRADRPQPEAQTAPRAHVSPAREAPTGSPMIAASDSESYGSHPVARDVNRDDGWTPKPNSRAVAIRPPPTTRISAHACTRQAGVALGARAAVVAGGSVGLGRIVARAGRRIAASGCLALTWGGAGHAEAEIDVTRVRAGIVVVGLSVVAFFAAGEGHLRGRAGWRLRARLLGRYQDLMSRPRATRSRVRVGGLPYQAVLAAGAASSSKGMKSSLRKRLRPMRSQPTTPSKASHM